MHSGIGDKAELTSLGLPTFVNLPSVGKNASDQPTIAAGWSVNSTDTEDNLNQNATLLEEAFKLWNAIHKGPFGVPLASHVIWQRLPKNSSVFWDFPDPAAGPNTPHVEIAIGVSICFLNP